MIAAKCKRCGTIGCNGNNTLCNSRGEWSKLNPNLFKDIKGELITAQDEYTKFLGEELGKVSSQLSVYGWRCTEETVSKGTELRAEIERLKTLLK